jgi:hypothetical protein
MLTKFLTFSWTLLFKSLYLCNNSKYAAMRTRHILLFALVLLVTLPMVGNLVFDNPNLQLRDETSVKSLYFLHFLVGQY